MVDPPEGSERTEGANIEDLFAEHYRTVLYWFLRQGEPKDRAEDLTQDVFVQAHKGLQSFQGKSSLKTWILRIARNTYLNFLRDRSTQKRAGLEVSLSPAPEDDRQGIDIPDLSEGAEETLVVHEKHRLIHGALADLPPQMRQCLELRLEDFKYREIAVLMNLSIDTVKSHLHQARKKLRESLSSSGEPPSSAYEKPPPDDFDAGKGNRS